MRIITKQQAWDEGYECIVMQGPEDIILKSVTVQDFKENNIDHVGYYDMVWGKKVLCIARKYDFAMHPESYRYCNRREIVA